MKFQKLKWVGVTLVLALILSGCPTDDNEDPVELTPYEFPTIPGYVPMPEPDNNETTEQGVELGRKLFYDPILSADSSMSCATCHNQKFAFSDNGTKFSTGITGEKGGVNAPAIINAAWNDFNFWDGRAKTLEDQALGPVTNPIEMASKSWGRSLINSRHIQHIQSCLKMFLEPVNLTPPMWLRPSHSLNVPLFPTIQNMIRSKEARLLLRSRNFAATESFYRKGGLLSLPFARYI